jgi:hypothetical protein
VAFASSASNLIVNDANSQSDIFAHDRITGQIDRVSLHSNNSEANGGSFLPSISPDGRYVSFESEADNLVGLDFNGCQDVFVRDRGAVDPVLTATGGCPGPVTLDIRGAGAHAQLLILHGAAGSTLRTNPPCAGLMLAITQPNLAARIHADGMGRASFSFHAPAGICGQTVQVVDLDSCLASNAVTL